MEATQINPERFGNDFPESQKIEAGDIIEVASISAFETESKLKGVSLTDLDGKLWHTTAKQPVGYITSPNVGLDNLIKEASDGAVRLYFSAEKPTNSRFDKMLKCSVFKPKA
jgi:hypothetical protein